MKSLKEGQEDQEESKRARGAQDGTPGIVQILFSYGGIRPGISVTKRGCFVFFEPTSHYIVPWELKRELWCPLVIGSDGRTRWRESCFIN